MMKRKMVALKRSGSQLMGALAFTVILLWACEALAHGTGYTRHDSAETVSFSFYYASGEPMAYCAVSVFSPDNAELEFQNGRTDQRGGFAFLPNQTGAWKVHVKDGRGHAVQAEVPVADVPQGAMTMEGSGRIPPWIGVLLGLSLLGNAFLAHRQRRGVGSKATA